VITNEDIRRSGVVSLPEALRLAPNLQVAQINASQFAISARGFNNALANKLLVLIDGRTVYTPLFSGVYWDTQDVLLEDIDRIEVISGPGATLWGANAVNGVINVITRSAQNTKGGLLRAEGSNLQNNAAFRYGGDIGTTGHYRVYVKQSDLQNTETANGTHITDGWRHQQMGFRADWGDKKSSFTLQGDTFTGKSDPRFIGLLPLGSIEVSGTNLLSRWDQQLANGSTIRIQAYYDYTKREDSLAFQDEATVMDIQAQHGVTFGSHKILWGAGYRHGDDETQKGLLTTFFPANKSLHWSNLFAQDAIKLSDKVEFTAGGRLDKNDYTGTEFLPSIRLAWKPVNDHFIWAAASRAVRAPSRIDREFFLPGNPPFAIRGGPNFQSEISNVFEIGYRAQPVNTLSYSVTLFHHRHDKLRSGQPATSGGGFFVENRIEGTTTGIEAWATYQMNQAWRLSGGLTSLRQRLHIKPDSLDPTGPSALGNDPKLQWMLRSALNLTKNTDFDVMIRHVSALPDPVISSYTAVDTQFYWRLNHSVDLSLTLKNIFDPRHTEFAPAIFMASTEFERSALLKMVWRY